MPKPMKDGFQPVIAPYNRAPNYFWVWPLWLLALTIKVFELDTGFYWVLGTLAAIMWLGTYKMRKETREIDLFQVLRDDASR